MSTQSHHTVRESIRERIESGEWALGALIPGEISLASEYGCARTTINRALQALANDGMLVRKRKGGTRVCEMPVRQAKLKISIVREQVEALDYQYTHQVLKRSVKAPAASIRDQLDIAKGVKALYLETLHSSDGKPFAYEERWVNIQAVPEILEAPLKQISINEWLVQTVPFSRGDVAFSAINASSKVAAALKSNTGNALFVLDRTTWMNDEFITTLKLYYKDGYRMHSEL